MATYKLGDMEQKFAELIWTNAPLSTRRLVELAAEAFGWKRTTTYTMLKRLCERGLFAMQTSLICFPKKPPLQCKHSTVRL